MGNNAPLTISERKLVTIVFMDIVDSLVAIRDVDLEEAHDLLSEIITVMSASVHRYGGVVVRTLGDGLMALFGAPAAQEDHATRAALAALRVQDQLSQPSERNAQIRVRIGVHSGIVAIGGTSNDFAVDFDATGVVVHIAARLQNLAPPGKVVITGQTKELISRDIITEFFKFTEIKGLSEHIETFVLVGPRSLPHRVFAPKNAVVVGREKQLLELRNALLSSIKGKGAAIAVVGEAGIGKSTLLNSIIADCPKNMKIFLVHPERYSGAIPFKPFRDIIIKALSIDLTSKKIDEHILQQLAKLSDFPDNYIAAIHDLCDIPVNDARWAETNPLQRRRSIFSAVRDVIVAASLRHPLGIFIEDIQRTDPSTIELIEFLQNSIVEHRIFFVVTYRPNFENEWQQQTKLKILAVDKFSDDESRRLLKHLVGSAAYSPLASDIARRSGGNPLFLGEFVRSLTESGILEESDDRERSLRKSWDAHAPLSIASIVAERIDSLPSDLRETLLAASVLGERFSSEMLAGIADISTTELSRRLLFLERAQFVRASAQDSSYSFVHGLFQEVAYSTLLKRRRQKIHQAAFRAIHSALTTEGPVEHLAEHAFNGGLWLEAVNYCRLAGRRAAARWSHREAVVHLENAVIAHSRIAPEATQVSDAIALRLELRLSHLPLLHLTRAGELLDEACEIAETRKNRYWLAVIFGLKGGHAYLTHGAAESIRLCTRSLKLASKEANQMIVAAPSIYLAQGQYALGKVRQAVNTLNKVRPLIETYEKETSYGLPASALVLSSRWMAIAKAELGQFLDAERLAGNVTPRTESMRPFEYIYSQATIGFVLMIKGDFESALIPSKYALEAAEETDTPFMVPVVASQMGLLLARQGRYTEALSLTRRAVREAKTIGISAGRSRWYARLAEACLFAGELDEALKNVEEALRIALGASEMIYLCTALRLRGQITYEYNRDIDNSRKDFIQSLAVARRLNLGPELAKCHFELGRLEAHANRGGSAVKELTIAKNTFERYGMNHWVGRVQSVLAGKT